jgi:hypothetical protein
MPGLDADCVLRWLLDDIPEQTARVEVLLRDGRQFEVPDTLGLARPAGERSRLSGNQPPEYIASYPRIFMSRS